MSCRAAGRLRVCLGRRGAFLLILGTGKTCWGVGFLVDPQDNPQGLDLLLRLYPIQSWAWLWIVAGLVTLGSAFVSIGRDWVGFAVALLPPTVWAIAYTAAVVSGDYSRGLWLAIWYLTSHVGVILWASATPEYSVPPPPRPARKGKAA